MKGVGIHCFAGGFTIGVKQVLPVVGQLEIHNFGRQTCAVHNTEFMNADSWEGWFDYKEIWEGVSFCYGNPRCTSFSSYSAGGNSTVRGSYAKPVQDIWDLCRFGIKAKLDVIAFESVQQCYTVGRELLDKLRDDLFVPNHYRIAHLFVNTAAEGNAQRRRRYFFVAYRNNKNFNVMLPDIPKKQVTVSDVIKKFLSLKTSIGRFSGKEYDYTPDSYKHLKPIDAKIISCLQQGESYAAFAKNRLDDLEKVSQEHYDKWVYRTSGLPFSLHSPRRLRWNNYCPTIASTSGNHIHPLKNRPLTVRELAALMGWPKEVLPVGEHPIAQIGKGVVPATGAWLANQIKLYLEDFWGNEDFSSRYDTSIGELVGEFHTNKPVEKVFHLTNYVPLKET